MRRVPGLRHVVVAQALPVGVADHRRALTALRPVAARAIVAGREGGAVRLGAGEDVVHVRRVAAAVDLLALLRQRRVLGEVVLAVELGHVLRDDDALGVLPGAAPDAVARVDRAGPLRAQVRVPRFAARARRLRERLTGLVRAGEAAEVAATLLAVVLLGAAVWAQAPRDVVVVGMEAEPPGLDPGQALGLHTLRVTAEIFETLVATPDDSTDVIPGLAESWTTSSDGLTWTFKLRKGVRFHDGTALAAVARKAGGSGL